MHSPTRRSRRIGQTQGGRVKQGRASGHRCVGLCSFPKSMRWWWYQRPTSGTVRHYEPWCATWRRRGSNWCLHWTLDEIKRYYLYHLLLHELGHLNDPRRRRQDASEEFAEDFALTRARGLGELPAAGRAR